MAVFESERTIKTPKYNESIKSVHSMSPGVHLATQAKAHLRLQLKCRL